MEPARGGAGGMARVAGGRAHVAHDPAGALAAAAATPEDAQMDSNVDEKVSPPGHAEAAQQQMLADTAASFYRI